MHKDDDNNDEDTVVITINHHFLQNRWSKIIKLKWPGLHGKSIYSIALGFPSLNPESKSTLLHLKLVGMALINSKNTEDAETFFCEHREAIIEEKIYLWI